jgi:Spy/CpxP family protein refolding chaperone
MLLLSAPSYAFGPGKNLTPPQRKAVIQKKLDAIGATPDQRSAIRGFVEDTLPTLRSIKDQRHELRKEMRDLFLAPTVDRSAVEAVRQDAVDLFDLATETVLDLMVDAANVLTVEQRLMLDEIRPSISADTLANENADQ